MNVLITTIVELVNTFNLFKHILPLRVSQFEMGDRTNISSTLVVLASDRFNFTVWAHSYSRRCCLTTERLIDTPSVLDEMVDTATDVPFHWLGRIEVILDFHLFLACVRVCVCVCMYVRVCDTVYVL